MFRKLVMTAKAATPLLAVLMGSAMFLSAPAAASQDGSQGMLLLHSEAQNAAVDAALPGLEAQGCDLWRQGSVARADGSLDIGSPDHFAIWVCAQDGEGNQRREALNPILFAGTGARLVEGPIRLSDADKAESVDHERAYLIKFSRFTNLDPDGQKRDIDKINSMAAERTDPWKFDGFITGFRAVGMPTPDEVAIVHYDGAEQRKRFRVENPDILKLAGEFNKKYLIEYTYISAVPAQ